MLAGLVTGYEGRFDFPRRTSPPTLTYLIATLPRTGSTWFSHLLWQTGCLGAPLEYLNFEPTGPYYFAARSTASQQQLWHSLMSRRTSPNGLFGLKCFPDQLESLQQENPQLLSDVMSTFVTGTPTPRMIYLERVDRTAHAISYARATLSGVWRREQEVERGTEVTYSEIAIKRSRESLERQAAAWEEFFRDLRIEPYRISYEEILAEPERSLLEVGKYLGVELDREARIEVPAIGKQSDQDSKAWAQQFARGDGVRIAD